MGIRQPMLSRLENAENRAVYTRVSFWPGGGWVGAGRGVGRAIEEPDAYVPGVIPGASCPCGKTQPGDVLTGVIHTCPRRRRQVRRRRRSGRDFHCF